jgi:hypothetical protein
MPGGTIPDDLNTGSDFRPSFKDRLSKAVLKPAKPNNTLAGWDEPPLTPEELEDAVASANDKERMIGLIAAPLAAIVSILITATRVTNNPPALLKNGQVNKLHVNVSQYQELAGVLIARSLLMLVTAMMRKRLFLGITTALFGLAIFNLHYWGFGVPFVMVGAWYLVRAYRLQRDLRESTGGSTTGSVGRASQNSRPSASKRYTPPAPRSKRWGTPAPKDNA